MQPMEELSRWKRKVPNRHQEEEPKVPQTTHSKPRRKKSVGNFAGPDPRGETEYVEEAEEVERMTSISKTQVKPTKGKGKLKGDGPPSRKKARKLIVSDSEEDDYLEVEAVPEEEDFGEDDDVSSEEEKSRGGKGKGMHPAGKGKKRKARGDPVDQLLLEGEIGSTLDVSAKTSPTALKPDSPQLKKLKLPAIKKNKPQATTATSTPISATPTTKSRLPLDIISAGGSKQSEIRKAQLGASDLDLSNKSIYQELFKTSSDGGAPRTGLNRRAKEEERRKELNKLRDEYLVNRSREEAHSFDLQARHEKVARFEDKLRHIRSAALFPNVLAAKWKEVYEREKKRQGGPEWNEDANGREEGEVK